MFFASKICLLREVLSPKKFLSVAEMWRSKRQTSIWVHEKKKKYITIWWPAVYQSCTQNQRFPSPFFCLGAPRSPETLGHSPPLRGRPRDALFCIVLSPGPFLFFKVLAILLGFWKLRNFLRPINASMKEAKAKRWIALRLVLCR